MLNITFTSAEISSRLNKGGIFRTIAIGCIDIHDRKSRGQTLANLINIDILVKSTIGNAFKLVLRFLNKPFLAFKVSDQLIIQDVIHKYSVRNVAQINASQTLISVQNVTR